MVKYNDCMKLTTSVSAVLVLFTSTGAVLIDSFLSSGTLKIYPLVAFNLLSYHLLILIKSFTHLLRQLTIKDEMRNSLPFFACSNYKCPVIKWYSVFRVFVNKHMSSYLARTANYMYILYLCKTPSTEYVISFDFNSKIQDYAVNRC